VTAARIALAAGIAVLLGFVVLILIVGHGDAASLIIALVALAALIGAGNALYGANSPYVKAQARTRPAQEAQNRAIDEARAARSTPPAPSPSPPEPPPA
jgi:hypothetical protein